MDWYLTFRLVSDVDENELLIHLDNLSCDQLSFLDALETLFIKRHEVP